jgi:hypothetical protein
MLSAKADFDRPDFSRTNLYRSASDFIDSLRKEEIVYDKEVYKKRGLIERIFGKL